MRKTALLLLCLVRCSTPAESPPVAAPPAAAPAVVTPAWPDPGPRFARTVSDGRARALQDLSLRVEAQHVDKGHRLLALRLPGASEVAADARVTVLGERYGMGVVEARERTETGVPLYVRLTGAAPVDALTLVLVQPATPDAPGFTQRLSVSGGASAPVRKDLPVVFFEAAARFFERGSFVDGFFSFASARVRRVGKTPLDDWQRRPRTDLEQTMSLYTGLTSVNEALQTDRGLRLRPAQAAKADIELAKVTPVALEPHPWPAMGAELQRRPVIEPLAAHVPGDVLYVHFHDLRTLAALNRELDEWLGPLMQVLEGTAGDRQIDVLYNTQLAVERTALSEAFGNLAAGGVALLAGDPLLREGTDLTIVFEVKSEGLLESSLRRFEDNLRAARADLRVSTYELGGNVVRLLSSPDRAVQQHRLRLGSLLVLSNSSAALQRLVDVHMRRAPSLADSPDYVYMRALYPHDPAEEDGFAYMSDAFVARVVGPRWKILAARRMQARADLLAVGYAALLHGWLEGHAPASADELVKSGLLERAELRHADGAVISFDPASGPRSAWGSPRIMVPIADLALDRVTAEEVEAYQTFSRTYQAYWSAFIDPAAVRLTRRAEGKQLVLDARMLPLIQRTEYDDLVELNGTTRAAPPRPHGAIQGTFAIGENARLRRQFDELGQAFTGRALTLAWVGDWCMVGAGDRSGLWDLAYAFDAFPRNTGPTTSSPSLFGGQSRPPWIQALLRASLYAGVHVKNELVLAGVLTALRGFAEGAAPGLVSWAPEQPFRGVPITAIRELTADVPESERLAIYYTVVRSVLLISLDRATLEQQMLAVLDERAPRAHREPQPRLPLGDLAAASQSSIDVGAGEGRWLARTLLGVLENLLLRSARNATTAHELMTRGLGSSFGPDAAARQRLAFAYLGYEPSAPARGALSLDERGGASHSLYGGLADLRLPSPDADTVPLAGFVLSIERLVMRLAFEGQEQHRGLHTRVELERR